MMTLEDRSEQSIAWSIAWSIVGAAVRGAAHRREEIDCQDYFTMAQIATAAGDSVLLLVLADGAGSAIHALQGAKIASDSIIDAGKDFFAQGGLYADLLSGDEFTTWIIQLREAIEKLAELNHCQRRDYATTLSFALIHSSQAAPGAVFVQLGDGATVFRSNGEWRIAAWPQHGEYANSTHFVTDDDSETRIEVKTFNGQITDVAMITDGLERLALNHHRKEIHQPFFDDLIQTVRSRAKLGFDSELSAELAGYLSSEAISNRCDDDCTIVMATVKGGSHGD